MTKLRKIKTTSALGQAIEDLIAAEPAFIRHRKNVKYVCCFRNSRGSVFAFERVTVKHINLWLPDNAAAKAAAEKLGLLVDLSVPWTIPEKYGRISSLKSIEELRDEPLFRVQVTTPAEAIAVLSALD
jgi:hypothetical protein